MLTETTNYIANVTHSVAQESMQNAAKEPHARHEVHPDDVLDIDCMFDGSWQKMGQSSLTGYLAAISPETRKCFDVELLSKVGKGCAAKPHLLKQRKYRTPKVVCRTLPKVRHNIRRFISEYGTSWRCQDLRTFCYTYRKRGHQIVFKCGG